MGNVDAVSDLENLVMRTHNNSHLLALTSLPSCFLVTPACDHFHVQRSGPSYFGDLYPPSEELAKSSG